MSTFPAKYRYEPLPSYGSTRLHKLTSLPYSPIIRGALVAFGWGAMPKYTAISYTCGSHDHVDRLHLDGNTYLPITQTAAYILLRTSRSRWLWIDAVCIDQDDNEEKSRQVQEMWRIYGNARLVLVWLGDLSEDADIALASLRLWKDGDELRLEDDDILQNAQPDVRAFWNAMDAMRWKALVRLFNHPYFRRSWILQELSAARKILVTCGGKVTLPWKQFEDAARCFSRSSKLRAKLFNASQISDRYHIEQVPSSKHKVLSVLSSCIEAGSGEPSSSIIAGAEAATSDVDDNHSVHERGRTERVFVRVDGSDSIIKIVTDPDIVPPRWRPLLPAGTYSCDFCRKQHCKDATQPDRRPFYLNLLLNQHARVGGFTSASLAVFASISRCVLTGGFDAAVNWDSHAKAFQRSEALEIVIKDKLRVRGPNSLDARLDVTLPPALATIN
jgi:hypothetical protein